MARRAAVLSWIFASVVFATSELGARDYPSDDALTSCPGYTASNVQSTATSLSADLTLAGPACNVYGDDLENLTLTVTYETATRLHVLIQDAANSVYQVPESVFPRPASQGAENSTLNFKYTESPFSFNVSRSDTGEVLFDSSAASLVFETQYLRLRTKLPDSPNLYGLGEHTDPFRLNTTDYIRTLWSQDAYGVPSGNNLYGNHPVYFDHRGSAGTHGVFLLNSNGMDIFINSTDTSGQYLEYNTLGGVFDLYFVAGPSPLDVAQQYAEIAGLPAMQPYWGLGFHQCRYGYQDVSKIICDWKRKSAKKKKKLLPIGIQCCRSSLQLQPGQYPIGDDVDRH